MPYELAKQLKDAGFEQMGTEWFYTDTKQLVPRMDKNIRWPDCIAAPTLEELIQACGDDFSSITKRADGNWIADCKDNHEGHIWFGSTPTEAIAHLWLALHT